MVVRVRHLIAALEELTEVAEKVDKVADDGVGNNFHNHVLWTIEFLKDGEVFHHDDAIVSFE
jgi:hypothetical protein